MPNFDRPYFQPPLPTRTSNLPKEGSYRRKQDNVLIGCRARALTSDFERVPKGGCTVDRQQLYVQHRMRVQNAKSVIDSKPPMRPPNGHPLKEMTFMELLNMVRNSLHTKSEVSPRTFTKSPETMQRTPLTSVRSTSTNRRIGDGPRYTEPLTSRSRRDKSAVSFSLSRSHCTLRSSEPVMRRYDMHKCNNHDRRLSWQSVSSYYPKENMGSACKKSPPLESGRGRSRRGAIKRRIWSDKTALPLKRKTSMSNSSLRNTKSTPRTNVAMHCSANVKSTVNLRQIGSEQADLQASVENLTLKELREIEESKKYNIPQHVLKRYEHLMVVRNVALLRKLLRPKIYFDIEVKGQRPLGRLLIQMYTEACPEVVLEFVRACTLSSRDRINFTRLLPPLWLEGELSLTDNRTLTTHTIEHDTDVLDHGSGPGILSFPSRYVRGSKRRFLSFSISFKPLQVLNGKRIAFGRVRRGHWILDAIQDYGTNSGKPKREILVTKCGLMQ